MKLSWYLNNLSEMLSVTKCKYLPTDLILSSTLIRVEKDGKRRMCKFRYSCITSYLLRNVKMCGTQVQHGTVHDYPDL